MFETFKYNLFFSRIYVWIFWVLNATEVAIPFLFSLRLGWINEITELYRINYLRILQTWFLVHKHFQLSSGMKWWKFSSSLKIEEWIEILDDCSLLLEICWATSIFFLRNEYLNYRKYSDENNLKISILSWIMKWSGETHLNRISSFKCLQFLWGTS